MESLMEPPKPKISLKTVIFPLIGLAAFFLYIYLFQVDIPAIPHPIRHSPIIQSGGSVLLLHFLACLGELPENQAIIGKVLPLRMVRNIRGHHNPRGIHQRRSNTRLLDNQGTR